MSRHAVNLFLVGILVASGLAVALPGVLLGVSSDPATVGVWEAPFEGQVPAISMALLEDGSIVYWGGVEARDNDGVFFTDYPHDAESRVIHPPYTAASVVSPPTPDHMTDLFCAGQTILPDGRVLTGGGSDWRYLGEDATAFVDGIVDSYTYDPATGEWAHTGDLNTGRWYPTLMTLADGRGLAVSGVEHLPQPQTHVSTIESWDDGEWTTVEGGDILLPMYPRIFTVPSGPLKGDLFYETVGTLWGPFGEHPLEAAWSIEKSFDLETSTWTEIGPSVFGARQHAASVMLPLDPADDYAARILTFGGTLQRSVAATSVAEITDLSTYPPTHKIAAPLNQARWHLNGVILPDDSVLALGGARYDNVVAHGQPNVPVLSAERFDPATGKWSELASMSVERMYHSSALLLPDGRVLYGGHVPLPVPWKEVRDNVPGEDQIVETRFEIYNPPYMFWGPRPVITDAPANIAYGAAFTVETPDAATVTDAVLIHPGATTHAWDVNERAVKLSVQSRGDGTITFVAPPDADVATPGAWMLFLRSDAPGQGLVPSVAEFVRLG